MTSTINLICFKCKHWLEFGNGCKAFPDEIPDAILRSNKHNKPIKKQKNNLVYEFNNNELSYPNLKKKVAAATICISMVNTDRNKIFSSVLYVILKKTLKSIDNMIITCKFALTVHITLPFRTASQGVSFALYTLLFLLTFQKTAYV